MKHLKKFDEISEGKDRYTIKGNVASVGNKGLPKFYTTSPDYMTSDPTKNIQKVGVNPEELIPDLGNRYTYLSDEDDHIDPKDIKKLMEPHVKKFNDFGFDPSEKTKK